MWNLVQKLTTSFLYNLHYIASALCTIGATSLCFYASTFIIYAEKVARFDAALGGALLGLSVVGYVVAFLLASPKR